MLPLQIQVIAQPSLCDSLLEIDSLTVSVVENINQRNHIKASAEIAKQLDTNPSSLKWHFLKGMTYYADLFIYSSINKSAMDSMRQEMEHVRALAEEQRKSKPDDDNTKFYLGGALGYLGIAMAQDGSLFGAVGTAKEGFELHEELIERNPACYNAYLGPGAMNFMTSAAPWILQPILWIFGLSGSEEKAFEFLSIAYEKGNLVRTQAGSYLCQLYERGGDFTKSEKISESLVRMYPQDVMMRSQSFQSKWHLKKYKDIIQSADEVVNLFQSSSEPFPTSDSSWLPAIVKDKATAQLLLGDTASGVHTLQDFVANPRFARIDKWRAHLMLADLYFGRRDTGQAITHYKSVLAGAAPGGTKSRVTDDIERLSTRLR